MKPNLDITDGFDEGDDERVIRILKKWDGGRLSTPLFTAIAKIVPIPTVETVILRTHNRRVKILLVPRPADDIVWNGMLHSPGGSIRRADYLREDGDPLAGVFARIESGEIATKFIKRPQFVSVYNLLVDRGPEIVQVFLAQIDENSALPAGAGWYDVDTLGKLPNFIKHQLRAIQLALEKYKRNRP